MLVVIASIIMLLILGSLWWFHRTDEAPKLPLHSSLRVNLTVVAQQVSDKRVHDFDDACARAACS